MQIENFIDSEDQHDLAIEMSMHDVSISSIKTQDSIENNSIRMNIDEEEHKEQLSEILHLRDQAETSYRLSPFLNFKDTQEAILNALSCSRTRLIIKPFSEVLSKINKISEDFQTWKKTE